MILILTQFQDYHADVVIDVLKQKGAPFIRFETADFPDKATAAFHYSDLSNKQTLVINGQLVDLQLIRTVWYRRPGEVLASNLLSGDDQRFVIDESRHFFRGLWQLLHDRFWVNPYWHEQAANPKPYQLQLAQNLGFDIPRTLITNDPDRVMDFFERCEGNMIYKTFTGYVRGGRGTAQGVYTNKVSRTDLESRLTEIKFAPCTFQEYIPKRVDIRVTVMGRRIFPVEIHSQGQDTSEVDWRRHTSQKDRQLPHAITNLPRALNDKIQALMSSLGLVFGCLDFALTPDGRFVFLEINPNGQWCWLEQTTGIPLSHYFSEMLIQATPDYDDADVLNAHENNIHAARGKS